MAFKSSQEATLRSRQFWNSDKGKLRKQTWGEFHKKMALEYWTPEIRKATGEKSKQNALKYWSSPIGIERRKQISEKMAGKGFAPGKRGRRLGSKNIAPYPKTEAVLAKFKAHPPPLFTNGKHSEETKQKQSETRIRLLKDGVINLTAYKQGFFKLRNPQKYKGDPTQVVYRSSWELKYFMHLDHDPNVLEWSSECIRIGYVSPKDGKPHIYFPDVFVKRKDPKTNKIDESIIEIKPASQVVMPQKTDRKTDKRYLKEVITYAVNDAKFNAARSYCDKKGWNFRIITENELGLNK